MDSLFSVIKAPLVTEKSTRIAPMNKHVFWVDRAANKVDIKRAVEKIYNVKVDRVATVSMPGKLKRMRARQEGRTSDWKKAVVTLKPGSEIKIT